MKLSREPVRVYAGGALLGLIGVLVAYGLVSGEQAAAWGVLVTALLGVPAVELARSKVTPVPKPRRRRRRPVADDGGFTLLEVVGAAFVFALVLLLVTGALDGAFDGR